MITLPNEISIITNNRDDTIKIKELYKKYYPDADDNAVYWNSDISGRCYHLKNNKIECSRLTMVNTINYSIGQFIALVNESTINNNYQIY